MRKTNSLRQTNWQFKFDLIVMGNIVLSSVGLDMILHLFNAVLSIF